MRRNRGGHGLRMLLAFALVASGVLAIGMTDGVGAEQTSDGAQPPVTVLGDVRLTGPTSRSTSQRVLVEVLGDNPVRAVREADPEAEVVGAFAGMALVRTSTAAADTLSRSGFTVRVPSDVGDLEPTADVTADQLISGVVPSDGRSAAHDVVQAATGDKRVKVGIIALFDAALYRKQLAAGKVPRVPASRQRCFTRGGRCMFGTKGAISGNLAAQMIWDLNENVDLYLVETGGLVDIRNAIDWLAAQGVDIVEMTMTVPWDGPGDGTGPAASLVDRAVRKGMMWVNPTGDQVFDHRTSFFNGSYWRGSWNDPDGDGWLNFHGDEEWLGVTCGFLYGLRWSDWGRSITDYDLYVGDATGSPDGDVFQPGDSAWRVGGRDQSAARATPLEANNFFPLCNRNPDIAPVIDENRDGYLAIYIERTDRTSAPSNGDVLELGFVGSRVNQHVREANLLVPFAESANPGMITVGAVDSSILGDRAAVTSTGPTKDGRLKPDMSDNGCVQFQSSGLCDWNSGLWSTTVAAHRATAQLAAHVARGDLDKAQFAQFVAHRRTDFWNSQLEPTNEFGWGRLRAPDNSVEWPILAARGPSFARYVSPLASRRDLDRWLDIRPNETSDALDERRPGILEISITGARRRGVLEVFGKTDLPGTQTIVPIDPRDGKQIIKVAVRDMRRVWLHSTTGGQIRADLRYWGTTVGAAARVPLAEPITLHTFADGSLVPNVPTRLDVPISLVGGAAQGGMTARVTVDAARAGTAAVGGNTFSVPAGRSTHLLGVGVEEGVMNLRSDVVAKMLVEIINLNGFSPTGSGSQVITDPVTVMDRSVSAGRAVGVDFRRRGLPAGTRQVLVRVHVRARKAGFVTVRERDGVDRVLTGVNRGVTSTVTMITLDRLTTTLRSTVDAEVTISLFGHSVPGLAHPQRAESPPLALRDATGMSISDDGSRAAFLATGVRQGVSTPESTGRLYVWDRTADTIEAVVADTAGGLPDAPVSLVAIAGDGSAIAYVSKATDLVTPASPARRALFVEQLGTGSIERFDLTGLIASADRIVDASSDLTTFVTAQGVVLRLAVDRSAVTVVRTYASSTGLEVSSDGSRVLLLTGSGARVAVVDAPGGPGPAVKRSLGAAMSGDGSRIVSQGAAYSATTGNRIAAPCTNANRSTTSAVDADGSVVVHAGRCTESRANSAWVTVDGAAPIATVVTGFAVPGVDVSGDGSTLLLTNDGLVIGAYDVP